MVRSYTSTHIPEPSHLLFHDNYCGITKDGELRPNGGGIWSRMDYADIHDNVFGPNADLPMIKDDGNDTIYVHNNYFGTNANGIKAGGESGAIYSTHISDNIQQWLPSDRLEYKYYEDNVFYGIKDYGIKTDSLTSFVTLRRNLFIDMPDYAIIDVQKKQVPAISSVEMDGDNLVIKGNAGAGSKVELFRSGNYPQSALKYLDIVDVDADGKFTKSIPYSYFDGEQVCISATATYSDRATSALSDPYCTCVPETTIVEIADTILVGGEIYGQTFSEVGVFDQIYENLISKKGCDSVVSHRVVVKDRTGAEDIACESISVYPNPVENILHVNYCDRFTYHIFDGSGRVMMQGESTEIIYVANLSNGLYILEVETETDRKRFKFEKQ